MSNVRISHDRIRGNAVENDVMDSSVDSRRDRMIHIFVEQVRTKTSKRFLLVMRDIHLQLHDIQSTSLLEDRIFVESQFAGLVDDSQVRDVGWGLMDVWIFVLCPCGKFMRGEERRKGEGIL